MKEKTFARRARADWKRNRALYLLVVPVIIFYIVFHYKPMYGAIIAFKDYTPALGVGGSPWVGLDNFTRFFTGPYFGRLLKNTVLLSVYELAFGFPAPIILALLLNELRNRKFKSLAQTVSYLPHFISMIVVTGMITNFAMTSGLFNDLIVFFGGERSPLLQNPKLYRTIYVASSVWQEAGWGSIIYLSALAGVDSQLYEAASIDGATRMQKIIHISIPCIMGTILILFIMRIGNLMSVGFEKVLLMQRDVTISSSEVISTFIYKNGIQKGQFSYSTAVGMFNSIINFALLAGANFISKKTTKTSLW